jgi:hypothetical protein
LFANGIWTGHEMRCSENKMTLPVQMRPVASKYNAEGREKAMEVSLNLLRDVFVFASFRFRLFRDLSFLFRRHVTNNHFTFGGHFHRQIN